MATRIVNKLYGYNNNLLTTKTSTCRGYTYLVNEVRTTFETILLESVKRATKNLESLIKALNKSGYCCSVGQIQIDGKFMFYANISDPKQGYHVVGATPFTATTAYQALRQAASEYGWSKLEG